MNSFSDRFIKAFRTLLPSPLTIAIILTVVTFSLALLFTKPTTSSAYHYLIQLAEYWEKGMWGMDLNGNKWTRSWQLPFLVQMMLMLVIGYILALSEPVNKIIAYFVKYCNSTPKAAAIVTFSTLIVSLFNWGLGLVFGAIFARKVGEYASKNNIPLNYGLIGAAGYSGLMIWHGGLSGSAPIKAAEAGSLLKLAPSSNLIIDHISLSDTIFSSMNISITFALLITLPIAMYIIGKKTNSSLIDLKPKTVITTRLPDIIGIEKLDHSQLFIKLIGFSILVYATYSSVLKPNELSLNFLTPDFINLILFGLAFLCHKSIYSFLSALDNAIGSASGILIQFPFYFGILGLMKYSGLMGQVSDFFVNISTHSTFAINTFFSAGLLNIFVPSGGGQWAVQGPIIIEAASKLDYSISKSIMAIAYGDQITNMLQPFWALPLLGITGLKAKLILPYTLLIMFLGSIIFIFGLILF